MRRASASCSRSEVSLACSVSKDSPARLTPPAGPVHEGFKPYSGVNRRTSERLCHIRGVCIARFERADILISDRAFQILSVVPACRNVEADDDGVYLLLYGFGRTLSLPSRDESDFRWHRMLSRSRTHHCTCNITKM